MPTNPFFDYFERTWNNHQTDHGQHPDSCTGLPSDQILDRVSSWVTEFNLLILSESQIAVSIRATIRRSYRW